MHELQTESDIEYEHFFSLFSTEFFDFLNSCPLFLFFFVVTRCFLSDLSVKKKRGSKFLKFNALIIVS